MGQQSQEGQLGIITQASQWSYDDPGGALAGFPHAGHFMKLPFM